MKLKRIKSKSKKGNRLAVAYMQIVSNRSLVDQRDGGHGQGLLGLGAFGNVAELLRVLLRAARDTTTQTHKWAVGDTAGGGFK